MAEIKGEVYHELIEGGGGIAWAFQDGAYIDYLPLMNIKNWHNRQGNIVFAAEDTSRRGRFISCPQPMQQKIDGFLATITADTEILGEAVQRRARRVDVAIRDIWSTLDASEQVVSVDWLDGASELVAPHTLSVQNRRPGGERLLVNGDLLTVYDRANPENIAWEGSVRLKTVRIVEAERTQSFRHQRDVDFAKWRGFFIPSSPALLRPRKGY